jgi:hypothetical protein
MRLMAGKLTQYRCTVIDEHNEIHTGYIKATNSKMAWERAKALLPWFQTLLSVDNVVERVARW